MVVAWRLWLDGWGLVVVARWLWLGGWGLGVALGEAPTGALLGPALWTRDGGPNAARFPSRNRSYSQLQCRAVLITLASHHARPPCADPDNSLIQHEFVNAVIRLARARYPGLLVGGNEYKGSLSPLGNCLDALMDQHVRLPNYDAINIGMGLPDCEAINTVMASPIVRVVATPTVVVAVVGGDG